MGFAGPYRECGLPIDEVSLDDLTGQPPSLQAVRVHNVVVNHDSVVSQLDPTHEPRRRQRTYYLADVTMIDEKVGQIIIALEKRGYVDHTIVVYTSEHGHSQKWAKADTITRVPMPVWASGLF